MPRTGVQFIKNDEPSFIRQFKQKIGHKDEPDVDAKRQIPNFDDSNEDDDDEREDEKPMVVVLKKGDLTSEEVIKIEKEKEEGPAHLDQKVTFKKPTKRKDGEKTEEGGGEGGVPAVKTKRMGKRPDNKLLKKKNTSLLSFGDDDEEGDD